jgi:hypothetical protein
MTTLLLACPEQVRYADLGRMVLVVNTATGAVQALLGPARRTVLALAETGIHTVNDDQRSTVLVRRLLADGVLQTSTQPDPWPVIRVPGAASSWGTQQIPAAVAPTGHATWPGIIVAAGAITAVLAAVHLGVRCRRFARVTALIGWATRWPRRAATHSEARWALDCVRAGAGIIPVRIACLEETAAATLLLALLGRGVGWCHGVAAEPARLHAWITLHGCPVGEPETTHYTPLRTITPGCCTA